jgi:hypothetical protein
LEVADGAHGTIIVVAINGSSMCTLVTPAPCVNFAKADASNGIMTINRLRQ